MPFPVRIPRINNNDDIVRLAAVAVAPGGFVRAGESLFEVESDKATVAVEAERDGYVLKVAATVGAMLPVGGIALWLGERADETVPADPSEAVPEGLPAHAGLPTAKARLLLARFGLEAAEVPHAGTRLTAADVEAHVAARGLSARTPASRPSVFASLPAPADIQPAEPARRGMLASVTWQRDHAAPAYLELPFDPAPWEAYAAAFGQANRMLFNPLLPLLAYRLVRLAAEMPGLNATMLESQEGVFAARYSRVNLGFTLQAGETLYLLVLAGADMLDEAAFVGRLADLQRRAIAHRLQPAEMQGATIAFSSMARWGVVRHVPVLAPCTAVMVAHSPGVLGVTYDHRVLNGFDAARLLRTLATCPASQE
jgi:pyruvate/2-oxoglutarate dehydrogenase complex dihydrolipoamide acyltransferase (E2) component